MKSLCVLKATLSYTSLAVKCEGKVVLTTPSKYHGRSLERLFHENSTIGPRQYPIISILVGKTG